MYNHSIAPDDIKRYADWLRDEEKSAATIAKYTSYARVFVDFLDLRVLSKDLVIAFKHGLSEKFTASGANGVIAAVNSLLGFMRRPELKVKFFKIRRGIFIAPETELSRGDLDRLLAAAQSPGKAGLSLVIRTIYSTGIRVSELRFITVQAVRSGRAEVTLKGKTRVIFLPAKLCEMLKKYIRSQGVLTGPVFVTKNGKPRDRSGIWRGMKGICQKAGVDPRKVFPHNLRRLFARSFHHVFNDLTELADILGHSSVDTTRIYTSNSGAQCRKRLDKLQTMLK